MRVVDLKPGETFKLFNDERVFARVSANADPQTKLCECRAGDATLWLHPDLAAEKIGEPAGNVPPIGRAEFAEGRIDIHLNGYGRHGSDGGPIVSIEMIDGRPWLCAWGEIDNPGFTHRISLDSAKVSS